MKTPVILCYGVAEEVSLGLQRLGRPLGISLKRVPLTAYAWPLAAVVAGIEEKEGAEKKASVLNAPLPEPMLLFANLPQGMLEVFLDAMRRRDLRVSLKAILTPHNAAWTAYELYHELCAERKALAVNSEM